MSAFPAIALVALAAAFLNQSAKAQEAGEDPGTIRSLVVEAVEQIHERAFRSEPLATIYGKALSGLIDSLGDPYQDQKRDLASLSDGEAQTAFMATLQSLAASPGQRRSLRDLAETALQAYCKQHDAYTRYSRSEDNKLTQLMSKVNGSGIGMTINEKNGALYCYPMPGSPAAVAGLKAGDKLLSVEGKSVEGKPLEFLASLIRGAPGTEVSLRVEHGFGRTESIKVIREALTMPTVTSEKKIAGCILHIRKFSQELIPETRVCLAQLSPGSSLTLDLRGCPGGELDVAIQFAALFLDPGEMIVTVRSRDQADEINTADKPREFKPAAIILLQDEGTASAAELVIAALVNSKTVRAVSQGPKTYGKGVLQSRIELRGGGSLLLTTGELMAPQGRTWDGLGLLPSLENEGRVFAE
jgi:carboxyl-terminal processing protease